MYKKKQVMLDGFLILILAIALSGCTQENGKNPYYMNQEYGFEIIPPVGWTVNENTTDPVKFFCPDKNEYQINVAVKAPISINESLDQAGEQLIEFYSQTYFKNFVLISSSQRTINNISAFEIVFSQGLEPNLIQQKQVLFERNGTIISVTYTSLVVTYDTYISVVDPSINSFRFF
jgi:hypothetical protein